MIDTFMEHDKAFPGISPVLDGNTGISTFLEKAILPVCSQSAQSYTAAPPMLQLLSEHSSRWATVDMEDPQKFIHTLEPMTRG